MNTNIKSKVGLKILFYSHDVMSQNNKIVTKATKYMSTHTHTYHALPCMITMMLLINKIVEDSSLPQYGGDIAISNGAQWTVPEAKLA